MRRTWILSPVHIFLELVFLVALVASQLGERIVRGPEGFASYRRQLLARG